MNRTQYLLTKLAEECVEVAQRAHKAQVFGLEEIQENQPFTNEQRLIGEFIDLLGVISLLDDEGLINIPEEDRFNEMIEAKKDKVEKYAELSRARGHLHD